MILLIARIIWKIDPVYHSILMVLHLITETFFSFCTLVAHCFDTLCYIFLIWSMLETPWKKKNEYVSYQDNIRLNSFYHPRPPTSGSSVPSLTDTSRAPTKASRTTSREWEFSQGTVCLEQNRATPGVDGGVGVLLMKLWRRSLISCSFGTHRLVWYLQVCNPHYNATS